MKKIICLILLLLSIKLSAQCTGSIIPTYTPESCPGCCDGSLSFSMTSFCAPMSYTISCSSFTVTPASLPLNNLCAGNYTIYVIDGCCNISCSVNITSASTGITEQQRVSPDIDMYPHPAKELLNISLRDYYEPNVGINVFDISGRKVESSELKVENGIGKLNTSFLNPGIYIIQVQNSKGQTAQKKLVIGK